MQIRKITVNGIKFEFVCESRNTRNGFAHDCKLFRNSGYCSIAEATCHYLNRTWECYTYESVIRKAVSYLIEERTNNLKDSFKAQNNISRMTKKSNEMFESLILNDEELNTYKALKEAVSGYNVKWEC